MAALPGASAAGGALPATPAAADDAAPVSLHWEAPAGSPERGGGRDGDAHAARRCARAVRKSHRGARGRQPRAVFVERRARRAPRPGPRESPHRGEDLPRARRRGGDLPRARGGRTREDPDRTGGQRRRPRLSPSLRRLPACPERAAAFGFAFAFACAAVAFAGADLALCTAARTARRPVVEPRRRGPCRGRRCPARDRVRAGHLDRMASSTDRASTSHPERSSAPALVHEGSRPGGKATTIELMRTRYLISGALRGCYLLGSRVEIGPCAGVEAGSFFGSAPIAHGSFADSAPTSLGVGATAACASTAARDRAGRAHRSRHRAPPALRGHDERRAAVESDRTAGAWVGVSSLLITNPAAAGHEPAGPPSRPADLHRHGRDGARDDPGTIAGPAPVAAARPATAEASVPSFDELYRTEFAFVWRTVAALGATGAVRDDIVQEVFSSSFTG